MVQRFHQACHAVSIDHAGITRRTRFAHPPVERREGRFACDRVIDLNIIMQHVAFGRPPAPSSAVMVGTAD